MENAVSRTAYYTVALRAADAASPRPIGRDTLAKVFLDDEAKGVWAQFADQKNPNDSNAARHRVIDELLQAELDRRPDARVVIVGCGFDTRAFRLAGGRWLEVDEPAILRRKDEKLPAAQAPNALVRVPVDFARDRLEEKLAPYASGEHTFVVVEGVFMYLTAAQRDALVTALRALFPRHTLVCDLMRAAFFEKFSRALHERIAGLGATFATLDEAPDAYFVRRGYRASPPVSILMAAKRWGGLSAPGLVVRFYKTLRQGYEVWRFETA